MGWCSGTDIMIDIINTMNIVEDNELREKLYAGFITAFEWQDWDCQEECLGMDDAFDNAVSVLIFYVKWHIDTA